MTPEETTPEDTLTLGFWTPELGDNELLCLGCPALRSVSKLTASEPPWGAVLREKPFTPSREAAGTLPLPTPAKHLPETPAHDHRWGRIPSVPGCWLSPVWPADLFCLAGRSSFTKILN